MAFTDNFTGTSGDNLEDRTGWTRVDGVAGAAEVNASNQLKASSTTQTCYRAPDAGSANHYAQAHIQHATGNFGMFPVCIRVTDLNNFIGFRLNNVSDLGRAIYKRVASTFTRLYDNAGDTTPRTYKLEGSGNDINLYRDGTPFANPLATTTDHNTVTYPGLVCRTNTQDPWIDDWESTQAAAGGAAKLIPFVGWGGGFVGPDRSFVG